jgi:hypothetical protein
VIRDTLNNFRSNVEVVVVVHGGNDDPTGQLSHIVYPRLRIITSQPERGKGAGPLNTGSADSHGACLAWPDSDVDLNPTGITSSLNTAVRARVESRRIITGPYSPIDRAGATPLSLRARHGTCQAE